MKRYWRLQWWTLDVASFRQKNLHHWKHNSTRWILQSHGRIRSEVSNPTYFAKTHLICILDRSWTIQGWLIFWREPFWGVLHQKLHIFSHYVFRKAGFQCFFWFLIWFFLFEYGLPVVAWSYTDLRYNISLGNSY